MHNNLEFRKKKWTFESRINDPQIQPHAGIKMAQVLGSLVYICGLQFAYILLTLLSALFFVQLQYLPKIFGTAARTYFVDGVHRAGLVHSQKRALANQRCVHLLLRIRSSCWLCAWSAEDLCQGLYEKVNKQSVKTCAEQNTARDAIRDAMVGQFWLLVIALHFPPPDHVSFLDLRTIAVISSHG